MYLKLAWRNLWRNRRRTLITVSSIMCAVLFSMFIESIERGSHNVAIDNMTRFHTGYMQVQDYRFEDTPTLDNTFQYDEAFADSVRNAHSEIAFVAPRIETFMLAAGPEKTRGSMVMGIDPDQEDRLNGLKDRIREGGFSDEPMSAVVAEGLAERLEIGIQDTLVLLGQGRFGMTAAGKFLVSGLIELPLRELNNQTVYLNLEDAQWLFSADQQISNLLITPESPGATEEVARAVENQLTRENLEILTWRELIPELVEALAFDRASTRFMMGILYIVIGFGIFGTILTMTLERLHEFGLLLSVGMHRLKLSLVVFIETLLMGILGVLSGFGVSYFILLYFKHNPLILGGDAADIIAEYGFEPIIPAAIEADIFMHQGIFVFAITVLISLYPIIKIMGLNIMNSMRP